ncbi:MAG TPA: alpha/beta fold hydrolase [Spirochaetales bacterium]|nr:alpha/beta fold hydrolase [Spirochaetales bacterium]HRY54681.1 alpha/beta fold hydrolase [Spirochaetia bacterium]HRZ63323.1 alpha/beta fold hydrolase [Spirochaetia bacterium]
MQRIPALTLLVLGIASFCPRGHAEAGPKAPKPWHQLDMMADPILDQVLLFYLGEAWTGMTDVGECLETASRVRDDEPWSWTRAWKASASRLAGEAAKAEAGGQLRTAGQSYLRASSYYRAAAHRHPDPAGQDMAELAKEAVRCYRRALELLPELGGLPVRIPYEGTSLPGYYFKAEGSKEGTPLLIVQQGRDAWAQDCTYIAREALSRGISCLLFDGPGQGEVVRLQRLAFRPDWEKVLGPVVDWAQGQAGIDPSRIGVIGLSMGGALIPRAAAYEGRLKVAVANPGVLDWSRVIDGYFQAKLPELMPLLERDPAAFDLAIEALMREDAFLGWAIKDMEWRHGGASPSELMAILRSFDATADVGRIRARLLVVDGEEEEYGQARELYDALSCPKDYLRFAAKDAASLHVQVGALAFSTSRIMDWIERYL